MTIILSLTIPVMYMTLFATSFNELVPMVPYDGVAVPFIAFFLPGLLVMTTLSNTLMTSQSVFNEHLSNLLLDILSTPIQHRAYMTGKIIAGAGLAFIQSTLIFLSGLLIFRIPFDLRMVLIVCLITVPICLAMSGLYMTVLGLVKSIRAFVLTTNLLSSVLMFASSIFYPTASIPPGLRFIAHVNPATYAVDSLRAFILFRKIEPTSLGIIGTMSVFLTLTAVWVFRKRFAEI
jgi:ABC-2 type transport system permease protein